MDAQNDDKARELEELRTRMMKENMFLRSERWTDRQIDRQADRQANIKTKYLETDRQLDRLIDKQV
jgi:hypothetical protein